MKPTIGSQWVDLGGVWNSCGVIGGGGLSDFGGVNRIIDKCIVKYEILDYHNLMYCLMEYVHVWVWWTHN